MWYRNRVVNHLCWMCSVRDADSDCDTITFSVAKSHSNGYTFSDADDAQHGVTDLLR